MFTRSRTLARILPLVAGLATQHTASAQSPDVVREVKELAIVNGDSGLVAPGAATAAGPAPCEACSPAFDFKKVPPVRSLSRPGMFAIPPSGPGAYNLLAAVRGQETAGPPKFAYPPFGLMPAPFYDADFRYLDDPKTPPQDVLDRMKRLRYGDNWLVALGGGFQTRYMNEYNARLTQRDNVYQLSRIRPFVDIWYQDRFRLFMEGNFSFTQWQDLPPLPIDESGPDIQNLFLDVKLGEVRNAPVYLRAGRQELLFGSQRLVSPPDWANVRRTFQGLRLLRTGEKFDSDLFVVQPVIPNANALDSVDNNIVFAGSFNTYRPVKGQAIDLYYFMLDNTSRIIQQSLLRHPSTVHTIGSRYYGDTDLNDCRKLLWDVEGAIQFGERGQQEIIAGMLTTGLGMNFKKAPLNPTVWVYYDYASGDDTPNGGNHYTTFNQLFPFGHYYLGWADLVGRENIHDVNAAVTIYPAKWWTLQTQFHNFWLDNVRDGLRSPAGIVTRRDPTGRASPFVGHEIDVISNFHMTRRTDLLVGYSYLFGGGFLRATAGPNTAVNSSLAYAMFSLRY